MADSAVSFVVGRLTEFVVKEASVLREVGSDVILLKDKLQWLQTFVQQADQKRRQRGNAYMDVWVQQTREVALDVEDVLDEFMLRVDLRNGLPRWKKWFKFLSACVMQVSVRHELSGRIIMIRARLEQISQHSNAYITDYSSSAARASPSLSVIDEWDDELEVVGMNTERTSLEHQLLEGEKMRTIVSIIGESGIGKSTLAWMVYDTPAVKRRFKARAWLNLPPCITEADIVHFLYKRFCHDSGSASTMEEIHGALSEHLKETSYLIVVDGITKIFNWSSVLDALPDNDLGSRVVIINSLNDNGAALAGLSIHLERQTIIVHRLEREDTNLLFYHSACVSGNNKQHNVYFCSKDLSESEYKEEMDKACNDIFEITKGLPLAVLLLGRLLRRKEFPDQWAEVFKHLKSMERSSRLEGISALCFDDLPHYLKSCFLHFAVMPENLIHNARRLVRLWAAEGFLKPRKGETMEEVGHKYLEELISRGMVHLVKKDSTGKVWRVSVHQRLHAMALLETQEATFVDVYDKAHLQSSTAVRHLFLQNINDDYNHHMVTFFPKLRSILCAFPDDWESKPKEPHPQKKKRKSHPQKKRDPHPQEKQKESQVPQPQEKQNEPKPQGKQEELGPQEKQEEQPQPQEIQEKQPQPQELQEEQPQPQQQQKESQPQGKQKKLQPQGNQTKENNKEPLTSVLNLPRRSKLLRVIDLRGLQITKVPPEIGNFIHLRYLAIHSSSLVELPPTIANLVHLQTLDIAGSHVEKVTKAFWGISTLRHVLAKDLHLPKSVKRLDNMQALVGLVCIHPWLNNTSPLHEMINLRHLELKKLNENHWGALSDAFKKLESLRYLSISGNGGIPFTLFTSMSLRRLQTLELYGKIIMPTEEAKERCTLPNLSRLVLKFSAQNKSFMDNIGTLPCLAELVLNKDSYNGKQIVFSRSGFANLTNLVLRELSKVKELKIGSESLPKVKKIAVTYCTQMKLKLEGQQVLKNIKEFEVSDMPDNWGVSEAGALSEKFCRVATRSRNGQTDQRGRAENTQNSNGQRGQWRRAEEKNCQNEQRGRADNMDDQHKQKGESSEQE